MSFQADSIYWVEVEKVVPNPFQPRREFDEEKLKELADSIRMYGVLQPLTVTRKEVQRDDGTFFTEYELIAGERRLRASKLAGTAQVPVIIREGEQSEQEKLELAIIENLQREDLNAVDRALAFQQLADTFGLSHAQVAQKVGRSREYVSNSIRLLMLPEYIRMSLKQGDISEGHARTLLMLNDKSEEQEVIFKEIQLKKLSVRESERIIRKIAADKVRKKTPGEFDTHLIEIEKQFTEALGTRVQILKTDFGGKLTIDYFTEEDLSAILQRMRQESAAQAQAQASRESESAAAANRISDATPLQMERFRPPEASVPVPPIGEPQESARAEPVPQPEPADVPPPPAPRPMSTFAPATTSPQPAPEQSVVEPETPVPEPIEPSHDTPKEEVVEEAEAPKEDLDEGNLYSVRNFSV